jgi:hypothetical protein
VRAEGTAPPPKRYKGQQPQTAVPSKTSAQLMEAALVAAKANENKEKKAKQERDALLVANATKLRTKLAVMKRPSAAVAKASQPPERPSVAAAKAPPKPPAKHKGKNEGDKTEEVVEECEMDDDKEIEGEDGGTGHEAGEEEGHEAGEEEEKETDEIVEPEDEDSVGHATVIFGVRWGGEGKGRGPWSALESYSTDHHRLQESCSQVLHNQYFEYMCCGRAK